MLERSDVAGDEGFSGSVSGRVQGVGFRYFVAETAKSLGLSGYVRNLPDGRVEVAARGRREELERLAAALRKGPPGALVQDVQLDWDAPVAEADGFEVRF